MITDERKQELESLFWAETNEEWTQGWREELTPEEVVMVEKWDQDFETELAEMCAKLKGEC